MQGAGVAWRRVWQATRRKLEEWEAAAEQCDLVLDRGVLFHDTRVVGAAAACAAVRSGKRKRVPSKAERMSQPKRR